MGKRQLFLYQSDPGDQGGGNEPDPDPNESGEGEPQGGEQGGPGGQSDDLVPRSELTRVSREAAKYRRERNSLKTQLEEREEKDKDEVTKNRDKATKLEAELTAERDANRSLRVQVLASKVGIVQAARGDAARLLDWNAIQDPDDEVELESALRTLVKDKPFLLGNVPGGADAGAGGSRDDTSYDMNSLLRQAAGRA